MDNSTIALNWCVLFGCVLFGAKKSPDNDQDFFGQLTYLLAAKTLLQMID
ncbi:hypothetical protein [Marinomonas mediterranea]|nr:hypothetical protein [Marinomonas mediterranea]WCN10670.1 hypothetical protein GV055_17940 [Marinomonas mediterranea]